jgi:hypothetical protein
MSGLTESSSDITVPKRRTVSWDMHDPTASSINDRRATGSPGGLTSATHRSTPISLLQPILLDDDPPVAPPASIFTSQLSACEQPKTSHMTTLGSTATLQRNNLTGPGGVLYWNPPSGPDTASFVSTPDFAVDGPEMVTPTKQQPIQPKRYSLQEVLDANPREAQEEVLVMNRVESWDAAKSIKSNPSLLPLVPNNRVHDFEEESEEAKSPEGTKESESTKPLSREDGASQSSNLFNLTKRLMEASPLPSESGETKPTHKKTKSEPPQNAGDKMYEAAATFFGSSEALPKPEKTDVNLGQEATTTGSDTTKKRRPLRRAAAPLSLFGKRFRSDVHYFAEFMGPQKTTIQ